jgi:DNA-binding Lrp family transcriptional regulator
MIPTADFLLLNNFQRDFPLLSRPFAAIAARYGRDERAVLQIYRRCQQNGVISRIGAVFAPRRIGVSTLVALAVPATELSAVAALVSAHRGVNHNYQRDNRYNLWCVVTAPDAAQLSILLADIERQGACPMLSLPLEEEFHIDLGFDLKGLAGSDRKTGQLPPGGAGAVLLSPVERELVSALQEGLPLTSEPYRRIAEQLGLSESHLIEIIGGWLAAGVIKRFGLVLRHHELGYTANAMCVWDVADQQVSDIGRRLAEQPGVTLCYRRRRVPGAWPYNLYCMIHGKAPDEVRARRNDIAARLGLDAWAHEVLFSGQRFKQQGACYAEPMSSARRHAIYGASA